MRYFWKQMAKVLLLEALVGTLVYVRMRDMQMSLLAGATVPVAFGIVHMTRFWLTDSRDCLVTAMISVTIAVATAFRYFYLQDPSVAVATWGVFFTTGLLAATAAEAGEDAFIGNTLASLRSGIGTMFAWPSRIYHKHRVRSRWKAWRSMMPK